MQEIFKQIKNYIQEVEPSKDWLYSCFQQNEEMLDRMFDLRILIIENGKAQVQIFSSVYEDLERLEKINEDQELMNRDEIPKFLKEIRDLYRACS